MYSLKNHSTSLFHSKHWDRHWGYSGLKSKGSSLEELTGSLGEIEGKVSKYRIKRNH